MLAGFLVLAVTKGWSGIKDLFVRVIDWKVQPKWVLFSLSPLLVLVFMDISLVGSINFLPNLGVLSLLLWILTSGVGEEVGWRGFALPRLQNKYSALKASLVLSIFWVGWHLPAFFYLPNYMKLGFTIFPLFVLGIMAGSVVYTWLLNSTKGNLLTAILFHSTFNFITASKAGEGMPAALVSTLVIIWAICIIFFYKPQTLSAFPKYEN